MNAQHKINRKVNRVARISRRRVELIKSIQTKQEVGEKAGYVMDISREQNQINRLDERMATLGPEISRAGM